MSPQQQRVDHAPLDPVSLRVALLATSCALVLGAIQQSITAVADWEVPSWGETLVQVVRDLGLVAIAICGFRIVTRRLPRPDDVGLATDRWGPARLAVLVAGALGLTVAAVAAVDSDLSLPLVLITVAVRWPISVVAQQVLFFGWLQPRLASHGLTTAALLFTGYHLYRPVLALLVVPLGLAFAYLRQRRGALHLGITLHWFVEVAFLLFS